MKKRVTIEKRVTFDKVAILALLNSTPMDIRDIITKLGITDISDARNLQVSLRDLEANHEINVEVRQGKKWYWRQIRQEETKWGRQEAEDHVRLEQLKKLVQVSESLEIPQMAKILALTEDDLYAHIVDWAAEFGFTLDRQVVRFGAGKKDDFIAQLDKEFQSWETGGKK